MSPRSKIQGRLPESLSLSLGLHALVLLIPLGAWIQSEGEAQSRTRVQLVDRANDGRFEDKSAEPQNGLNEDYDTLQAVTEFELASESEADIEDRSNPSDRDSTSAPPPESMALGPDEPRDGDHDEPLRPEDPSPPPPESDTAAPRLQAFRG